MCKPDDPCDDCSHWAGRLSYRNKHCIDCECEIESIGKDYYDRTRCCDCAAEHRIENEKSQCCNADLENVTIAHSEREGDIYADYLVCPCCEQRHVAGVPVD